MLRTFSRTEALNLAATILQFNSDSNQPQLAAYSTGLREVPQKIASFQALHIWEFLHTIISGSINLLEQLPELRKAYDYSFIVKNTNQDQTKEGHIAWGLEGSQIQSFCAPPPWNQDTSASWHIRVHQAGSSPKPPCGEFVLEFHHAGIMDWITDQVAELNLQPSSSSWSWEVGLISLWPKNSTRWSHSCFLGHDQFPFWIILSINSDVAQGLTMNNIDTKLSLGKLQEFSLPSRNWTQMPVRFLIRQQSDIAIT